jgi:UDP-N-acetylmuramate dehydrogenase
VNNNSKIKSKLNSLGILKLNESLNRYTSFKTGGPADILIWPKDCDSLTEVIEFSKEESLPITILGGCTNLLVGDKGIRGIVIMLNSESEIKNNIQINENGSVYSDSGIRKKEFLRFCVEAGYSGMEFLAGIPGCIGGGIVMYAGTVDGNFSDILDSIVYSTPDGQLRTQKITRDATGYRTMGIPYEYIVIGGIFNLQKSGEIDKVRARIDGIVQERKKKHPLNYPSAGSVFKNPPGHSSWKLINDAGLRGKKIGDACVSELHTNFIINAGKATSVDILNLIDHVKETVSLKFNILLEPEIKLLGEF